MVTYNSLKALKPLSRNAAEYHRVLQKQLKQILTVKNMGARGAGPVYYIHVPLC